MFDSVFFADTAFAAFAVSTHPGAIAAVREIALEFHAEQATARLGRALARGQGACVGRRRASRIGCIAIDAKTAVAYASRVALQLCVAALAWVRRD